jgi:hypothetical protein
MRSGHRMPVAAPPIESAEQFLGAKSQQRELVRALRRCIAADPIAIYDIDLAAVEACDGFDVHVAMWEADRAGDMGDLARRSARMRPIVIPMRRRVDFDTPVAA